MDKVSFTLKEIIIYTEIEENAPIKTNTAYCISCNQGSRNHLLFSYQFFQSVEPGSSALITPGPISVAAPDPGSSRSFWVWYTSEP